MAGASAADAKSYREAMKAKAERLGGGEDARNVDASDFTPAEKLYAGVKTGMRPVSRQARKDGGAVVGMHAGGNPGRSPRKGGGFANALVNRDAKSADAEREGHYPNGGMKKGGRTHRAEGGYLPNAEAAGASATRRLKRSTGSSTVSTEERPAAEDRRGRAAGGRVARQAGGPLATPLAAGMGGQGRLGFNFGPQASTGAKLGIKHGGIVTDGRAKAQARYGRVGRKDGGSVETKVLAAHHAEHDAMREGKAKGGPASAWDPDPRLPIYDKAFQVGERAHTEGRQKADNPHEADSPEHLGWRAGWNAQSFRHDVEGEGHKAGGRARAAGGANIREAVKAEAKQGHGPDCTCPRCAAKKAKGGLLSKFDADARAKGGRAARAKGGKAGTKINIIISPGGANAQPAPPPGGPLAPMRPPTPPVLPPPAAAGPPGMPPGGPPMPMPPPGAGGPPPPMPMRKRGGRVKAGAGSGEGRLQKIAAYGSKPPKGEAHP
jgi:hypothetical protein